MAYRARLLNVVDLEIGLVGSNPTDSAMNKDDVYEEPSIYL